MLGSAKINRTFFFLLQFTMCKYLYVLLKNHSIRWCYFCTKCTGKCKSQPTITLSYAWFCPPKIYPSSQPIQFWLASHSHERVFVNVYRIIIIIIDSNISFHTSHRPMQHKKKVCSLAKCFKKYFHETLIIKRSDKD